MPVPPPPPGVPPLDGVGLVARVVDEPAGAAEVAPAVEVAVVAVVAAVVGRRGGGGGGGALRCLVVLLLVLLLLMLVVGLATGGPENSF